MDFPIVLFVLAVVVVVYSHVVSVVSNLSWTGFVAFVRHTRRPSPKEKTQESGRKMATRSGESISNEDTVEISFPEPTDYTMYDEPTYIRRKKLNEELESFREEYIEAVGGDFEELK